MGIGDIMAIITDDSQVKIGGYRIELGYIEAHLRSVDKVQHAVCFVDGTDGRDIIVAGLLSEEEHGIADIRKAMADKLPDYMMPKKIFRIEKMPLNKSGKVDRISVRKMYEEGQA